MDLERIKQNFRIRSGRSKRRAAPLQSQNTQLSNGLPIPKPAPDTKEPPKTEAHQPASKDVGVEPEQAEEMAKKDDFNLAEAPSSEAEDFDLNPPEPRPRPPSLEDISTLLFSSDHLNSLLHQPAQLTRFSAFLQRYLPASYPLLSQYLETQKAIKAVEYANAVAEGLKPKETGEDTTTEVRKKAANLDEEFEHLSNASFRALVGDALPSFISYSLVKVASECLTNEMTGRSTPVMRDLVGGLSEVFCLTDPQQHDNPIIYASEEFYRLTRYGPEDTINNNCRFLQGRRTNPDSHLRLRNAVKNGEEICETLLNYRRDGKPFMNLLMLAPLHDKNGKLKYYLGAQIDVTGLVQGGRALDGFQRFLTKRIAQKRLDERRSAHGGQDSDQKRKSRALAKLRDLSEMFDMEESSIVQEGSRSNSISRDDDDGSIASLERVPRRVFGDEELSDDEIDVLETRESWEFGASSDGRLSGKLPGVYDSFMLIRAAPSLRIVFVSPKLQKIGNVLQTPFLSHVAAPSATLKGLKGSLLSGVPVSAKIHFMPERGQNRDGEQLRNGTKHEDGPNGKAVWVSLTPLLGEDDQTGVWMCVFVEKAKIGSVKQQEQFREKMEADHAIKSMESPSNRSRNGRGRSRVNISQHFSQLLGEDEEDQPIKPVRIQSRTRYAGSDGDHEESKRQAGETRKKQEVVQNSNEDQESEQHKQADSKMENSEDQGDQKSLSKMQSVYFDAEGGQQPNETMNHDSNTSQTPNELDIIPEESDPRTKAVITPIDEYESTSRDSVSYSINHSKTNSRRSSSNGLRRSIAPQQGHDLPRNERIVIEEDEDVLDEGSSSRGRSQGSPRSISHSPVWSPPSIPSSAQLASDDEEVDLVTSTRSKFPFPSTLGEDTTDLSRTNPQAELEGYQSSAKVDLEDSAKEDPKLQTGLSDFDENMNYYDEIIQHEEPSANSPEEEDAIEQSQTKDLTLNDSQAADPAESLDPERNIVEQEEEKPEYDETTADQDKPEPIPPNKERVQGSELTEANQSYDHDQTKSLSPTQTLSPSTSEHRRESPDDKVEESPDTLRPRSRDHKSNKSDNDSAIGMNSPAQTRHQLQSPQVQFSSQIPTSSAEPLKQFTTAHHSSDLNVDIEHWIHEGQPQSQSTFLGAPTPKLRRSGGDPLENDTHDDSEVEHHQFQSDLGAIPVPVSQVGMDYVRAGDHKLNRPLHLSREVIEEANRGMHAGQLTGSDDLCARSPYSVD